MKLSSDVLKRIRSGVKKNSGKLKIAGVIAVLLIVAVAFNIGGFKTFLGLEQRFVVSEGPIVIAGVNYDHSFSIGIQNTPEWKSAKGRSDDVLVTSGGLVVGTFRVFGSKEAGDRGCGYATVQPLVDGVPVGVKLRVEECISYFTNANEYITSFTGTDTSTDFGLMIDGSWEYNIGNKPNRPSMMSCVNCWPPEIIYVEDAVKTVKVGFNAHEAPLISTTTTSLTVPSTSSTIVCVRAPCGETTTTTIDAIQYPSRINRNSIAAGILLVLSLAYFMRDAIRKKLKQ